MLKFISRRLFYTLLLVCWLSACNAPVKTVMGPFLKLSAIESELKKGVSTKMDVQRILGAPQGFGGAVFPVTAEAHEIWFYQNIEYDNINSQQTYTSLDMNQKVLLVFFTRNLFDGFLWYTGTVKGSLQ
jgi:hypothetical protein